MLRFEISGRGFERSVRGAKRVAPALIKNNLALRLCLFPENASPTPSGTSRHPQVV